MNRIKKGDIVVRKSYGKDILFIVKNILDTKKDKIAILKGLVDRIEADSYLEDLEKVDKQTINQKLKKLNEEMKDKIIQADYQIDNVFIGFFAIKYEIFVKRWKKIIAKGDPYYNKNYRLDTDLPKINYNKIV